MILSNYSVVVKYLLLDYTGKADMIPVSLKLSNFTSYGENVPELDFTRFHLAAISGPNGAGKSSLLDAITWCLWGTSRAGDSSDQLVRLGANDMEAHLSFKLDKNDFTVKRRRSLKHGGSTALEFWSGPNNLTEGTIKSTQQKIIDTLHLSFETFTNSSFLRQGHADEFTTKGPTDRKRILADILGLSHYDLLEEKAKEKIKEADSKLKLLEYQILEIDAELSQKDQRVKLLEESKQKVSALDIQIKTHAEDLKILQKEKEAINLALEQRKKLEENLISQKKELEQIISTGKEQAARIKSYELKVINLEILDKEIEGLKQNQKQLDELRIQNQKRLELEKNLVDLQGQLSLKIQQKTQIEEELEKINSQIKNLTKRGAKCPTCGQEIGKDNKHKVTKELEIKDKELKIKISKINTKPEETEIKKLEIKISLLKFNSSKLEELEKLVSKLEDLQSEKGNLLKDQASLETERKNVEEMRVLYKQKNEQVEKLSKELETLPKLTETPYEVSGKLEQKEKELDNLRTEEKEARNLLGQATELLSRSEQLEKLYEQKKQERINLEKEKENFEELSLAFGKKGIQAMIIETAIPEIEDGANRLLDRLTGGRMKVSFETQRETKTKLSDGEKGIVETLDIIISDEMGERPYEMYSGGEAFRVNFAIRIALSKLLTRRAGAKLQFLVIDEGFGTQDVEGRTKIVEVLDTIKNDFEKILIITHLEELKEEFPVRIEVSKNSDGSTFEVVGI